MFFTSARRGPRAVYTRRKKGTHFLFNINSFKKAYSCFTLTVSFHIKTDNIVATMHQLVTNPIDPSTLGL